MPEGTHNIFEISLYGNEFPFCSMKNYEVASIFSWTQVNPFEMVKTLFVADYPAVV